MDHDRRMRPRTGADNPARGVSSRRGLTPAIARSAAAQSPWLARQPAAFRNALLKESVLRRVGRGERVAGLEETGSDLHFLLEGSVQASMARADSEVVATNMVSRLEWFGAYGALGDRGNILEYRATTPSVLLVVPRPVLQRALGPLAHGPAIDLLLDALKTYVEMAGGLTGLRSEDRVRSKLHALAGGAVAAADGSCVLHMSQDDLADVSCVSRSVVSKVVGQLAGDGILAVGYRRIVILKRDSLMAPPEAGRSVALGPDVTGRARR